MKKFISFALAASMALSMVPATAFAASDLTASHSNIRVTANTEFYPKKVADADASLTTREVPYILLEATTDFKYDEQTFELALENAEWLERKDDGDILFVETEEYMSGEDGIKFTPEGGTSTDTTTPPVTSEELGKLQAAYVDAATALKKAAEAYVGVLDSTMTTAQAELNSAQAELKLAKAAESAAKEKYDKAEEASANITTLVKAYEDAWAKAEDAQYLLGSDTNNAPTAPTLGNPDDTSLTSVTTGAYAVDSANTKVLFWVDSTGAEITGATAGDIADVTSVKAFLAKAKNQPVKLGGTAYENALKEWNNYDAEKTAYDKAVAYVASVDAEIAKAAQAIVDAGGKASTDSNASDVSGVTQKVADLLAEYEAAQAATKTAQKLVDTKQAAYDAAVASIAETKTAFDTALATRNTAGEKLVTVGGQGNGVDFIMDQDAKLSFASSSSDTAYGGTITAANGNTATASDLGIKYIGLNGVVAGAYDVAVGDQTLKVKITKKSDSRIVVQTSGYRFKDGDVLSIPLFVRTTGGVASVSIDSLDSEFTSQGKTFAKTADGDTELSIEKVQNFYDGDEIKNLYLEELVAGTIEPGKIISLRVNGDFQLKAGKDGVTVTRITGDGPTDVEVLKKNSDGDYVAFNAGDEEDEIYLRIGGKAKAAGGSTKATQYRIQGLQIIEDGADFGDEASITVSGGGTSKQTIKIGNYEDFGVKLTAEDKDLPVIYAGTKANSKYDNQTLKVTIEETVANSFIDNRKMEITLPEGVEFVNDSGKRGAAPDSIDDVTEDFKVYNFSGSESDVKKAMTLNDNGTKITISGKDLPDASGTNKDRKRKIEFSVHVSAEADFTGDVVMTLGGPGVADKNVSATVATVKAPIEVRTAVNELKIDYRNTEIADITLVEPEAGLWAKDDVINLEGERMSFESGAKAEVVNGDMKLNKYDGDYIDVNDGVLSVKVDSRSSKTPAEIKISGLSLYMDRSLAAGNYKLKVFGEDKNEFFMNNYDKDGDDFANVFETQKVTVMDDFVKIVTAGRDKDDATFTTKIVVPVGGDVITAGTKEIKLSEMQGGACPPAYINNDGYTMLPVRAVVEALNEIATVRWDDATKTCTIGFGQRVFSMTVGSKVLNLNGVSTALNAAPENKDGRVFLPLRDLGYALGLSDSQISWDSTTQTAQLN